MFEIEWGGVIFIFIGEKEIFCILKLGRVYFGKLLGVGGVSF